MELPKCRYRVDTCWENSDRRTTTDYNYEPCLEVVFYIVLIIAFISFIIFLYLNHYPLFSLFFLQVLISHVMETHLWWSRIYLKFMHDEWPEFRFLCSNTSNLYRTIQQQIWYRGGYWEVSFFLSVQSIITLFIFIIKKNTSILHSSISAIYIHFYFLSVVTKVYIIIMQ